MYHANMIPEGAKSPKMTFLAKVYGQKDAPTVRKTDCRKLTHYGAVQELCNHCNSRMAYVETGRCYIAVADRAVIPLERHKRWELRCLHCGYQEPLKDRPDVEWRVAGRPAEGEAAWGESHDWERSMHLWDATAHAAGMSLKDPNYRLS